jgi:hypothetical protein
MNKNRMRRPTVWGELASDREAPVPPRAPVLNPAVVRGRRSNFLRETWSTSRNRLHPAALASAYGRGSERLALAYPFYVLSPFDDLCHRETSRYCPNFWPTPCKTPISRNPRAICKAKLAGLGKAITPISSRKPFSVADRIRAAYRLLPTPLPVLLSEIYMVDSTV